MNKRFPGQLIVRGSTGPFKQLCTEAQEHPSQPDVRVVEPSCPVFTCDAVLPLADKIS